MTKSGEARQMAKQQKAIYNCIGPYIATNGYFSLQEEPKPEAAGVC